MRHSMTCPKCQGRRFYQVGECTAPACDSCNGTQPLSVAAAYLPTGRKGFLGADEHERFVAQLLAWVCASCGYTEFYVPQLEVLAYMAQHQAGTVRFIDATPGTGGAFR